MALLTGKRALITGGTSGIGLAIAKEFLTEGAVVAITGRDEVLGAEAQRSLMTMGAATFIRADASQALEVNASVDEAVAALGGLDILVNNAGVSVNATPLETSVDDFDFTMNINVRGAFLYAKACFPHLESSGGCMIHTASDASFRGAVDLGIYSVSKAAMMMLSNMLALECGKRGVRSNCLCPGDVLPGMRHVAQPDGTEAPENPAEWMTPPIGRIGTSEDVAKVAAFLASEKASFLNGSNILIDGGMGAGWD